MDNNKSNNVLLIIASIIIAAMMGVMYYQDKVMTNMRNLLEKTDTTTTLTVDTLYLEKTYTDTVPKYITQTIFKTDTVYEKEGDSISATTLLITLKKKKQPILQ